MSYFSKISLLFSSRDKKSFSPKNLNINRIILFNATFRLQHRRPRVRLYNRCVKHMAHGPKPARFVNFGEKKPHKYFMFGKCFVKLYFLKYEDLFNVLFCTKTKGKKTNFLSFRGDYVMMIL